MNAHEPNASADVLDARGQVVITTHFNGSTLDVEIATLAAGCYTLRLATMMDVSLARFSVVRP